MSRREEPKKREVDPKEQPDQTFREASHDDERSEGEHQLTTESPRFGEGEHSSTEVRGYPPEGAPRTPPPPPGKKHKR
jgi:hypothetical protein